ncbi:dynein light chain type 2, putative [Plasmodium gallinaceum]|uniref:Dynein light chain type 2, putative n=1 Tax=Plasmodium gallinaceum TaxID=5849 RepID=A0A1J1GUK3_PLAGA|nr:dynein light chain type 2, putative [Plasmodium gallinaceum]CRG96191.1 dynein light chain type 2, putative [Plasmodium gallinaceum]
MEIGNKNNATNVEANGIEKNNDENSKVDMEGFRFFANICEEKLKIFLENFFSSKNQDELFYLEDKIITTKTDINDENHDSSNENHDSSNENQNNYSEKNNIIKSNYDKMVISLVDDVEQFMKSFVNERYKIIVQGVIGENKKQGIHIASKSLWNVETDNYISANYVNDSIFVTVMVFLLYNE